MKKLLFAFVALTFVLSTSAAFADEFMLKTLGAVGAGAAGGVAYGLVGGGLLGRGGGPDTLRPFRSYTPL